MVTGCGCTDPVVFGHQGACERELGPRYAGEARTDPDREVGWYEVRFEPPGAPNPFSVKVPWHVRVAEAAPRWAAAMHARFEIGGDA